MTDQEIARFCSDEKTRLGLSYAELSRMTGFPGHCIKRWLMLRGGVTLRRAIDILRALGYELTIKKVGG